MTNQVKSKTTKSAMIKFIKEKSNTKHSWWTIKSLRKKNCDYIKVIYEKALSDYAPPTPDTVWHRTLLFIPGPKVVQLSTVSLGWFRVCRSDDIWQHWCKLRWPGLQDATVWRRRRRCLSEEDSFYRFYVGKQMSESGSLWNKWDCDWGQRCRRGENTQEVNALLNKFGVSPSNNPYVKKELLSRVSKYCKSRWPKGVKLPKSMNDPHQLYNDFIKARRIAKENIQQKWWKDLSRDIKYILKEEGVEICGRRISPRQFVDILTKTRHLWKQIKLD